MTDRTPEPTRPIPTPASAELAGAGELPAGRRDVLRSAWLQIQGSFIDEPGESVRKADGLVKELLASVSERFEAARRDLEQEWGRGAETSTESLRLALQRYRTLFERLLSF